MAKQLIKKNSKVQPKVKQELLYTRDTTWLQFNERVLQEAQDSNNHVYERLRFFGIYSNNIDEFFRVRIATLNNSLLLSKQQNNTARIKQLNAILKFVYQQIAEQQDTHNICYQQLVTELSKQNIFIKSTKYLNQKQLQLVKNYFTTKVRNVVMPVMIESITTLPLLKDRSLYLACELGSTQNPLLQTYALLEVPVNELGRFYIIPDNSKRKTIVLLEDIITMCLPEIFGQFSFNAFSASGIKIIKDAEIDFDTEADKDVVEQLIKGIKKRKQGKTTHFIYEKNIDNKLLEYIKKLLQIKDNGTRISVGQHLKTQDFMDFPKEVFTDIPTSFAKPSTHNLLVQPKRIMHLLEEQDVLLHFPYHSFDSIIDLLREASIDPYVTTIKITAYRLAKDSNVLKALINAARNGKRVTVVIELRARFDEEANLRWKQKLEEENITVVTGKPKLKVHSKLCYIQKKQFNRFSAYCFISTGNLNETTSALYGDHTLLTSNTAICADVNKVFNYLQSPKARPPLGLNHLILSPTNTRKHFIQLINNEVKNFIQGKPARIIIKLNNLTDPTLITALENAIKQQVPVQLIVRSSCCITELGKHYPNFKAISIVDNYLEHARVMYFLNNKKPLVYISSSDWMQRNLDYRVEATAPILNTSLQQELVQILELQLLDNTKARVWDKKQSNSFVQNNLTLIRSQLEIHKTINNLNN